MQVALICPTAFLDKVAKKSKFHMCLAPVALRDEKYKYFYQKQSSEGQFVILDNGVYETGKSVPVTDLFELVSFIKCIGEVEVVIPDVLYDSEATVRSAEGFIEEVREERDDPSFDSLMAVPQGRSIKEWMWCYEHLVQMEHVDTIGLSCLSIPMSFGGDVMTSRIACCELLESRQHVGLETAKHTYHLLGCGNPLELVLHEFAERTYIRSCDTSSPFVSGVHGIRYSSLGLEVPKIQTKVNFNWKPRDFNRYQLATVDYNVQWLLRHTRGKA